MIQQEYKNNVEHIGGQVQTTGFSIEVNESMFQLLTANVYNDPILAVMREWSTNACDACIAAGKDVKFDVHLPTLEEPNFHVRDYGTGLPPEDITGLFSNLGASTKRESDAYNGTLGIGRMAGLAVADAFTVESYYNGTHYSYAISMQNGVPVTLAIGSFPTTEPNGLKLSVAVDYDDLNQYLDKAPNLYKYFDHKPNLNLSDINIELDVTDHISDKWFMYQPKRHWDRTNYVVMSQVAYAIPDNGSVKDQGFSNMVIKAEPGSVTFNPGRESLSLNKSTADYLNNTFKDIAEEYVNAATVAMVTCSTDKELMECYERVTSGAPYAVREQIDPTPFTSTEYQQMFSNRWYANNSDTFEQLSITDAFETATNNKLTINCKDRHYKTSSVLDRHNTKSFNDFFNGSHVVVDLKTKFKAAINSQYGNKTLFMWQRQNGVDIDEAVTEASTYLDAMGVPYKLASEVVKEAGLDTDVKTTAPRAGFYASPIRLRNGKVLKSEKMESADITSNKYLFLKVKNTTPEIAEDGPEFGDYLRAYVMLQKAGVDMPVIKGVAKKYRGVVENLSNWEDFETYIKDKMAVTTFKVPSDNHMPSMSTNYINDDNYTDYPQELQSYYLETRKYKDFVSADNYYTYPLNLQIIKDFKGIEENYVPTPGIDITSIQTTFKKSLELMDVHHYSRHISAGLVKHLAKLEEFYAIHQTQ